MAIRFLHIADVHLGRGVQQVGKRTVLRDEREKDFANALENALIKAREQCCDFAIIAGDLFHRLCWRPIAIDNALSVLGSQFDGPIFIIEGNHDEAVVGDISPVQLMNQLDNVIVPPRDRWHRDVWFPKNDELFRNSMHSVDIWYMHWQGSTTEEYFEGMLEEVKRESTPRGKRIFVGHFGVEGMAYPQLSDVRSSLVKEAERYFDYIALGHIHKPYQMGKVHMPGNLNKTKWDERDDGLAYIVTIDDDRNLGVEEIFIEGRKFIEVTDEFGNIDVTAEELRLDYDNEFDLDPVIRVLQMDSSEQYIIDKLEDFCFWLEIVPAHNQAINLFRDNFEPQEAISTYFNTPEGKLAYALKNGLELGLEPEHLIEAVYKELDNE